MLKMNHLLIDLNPISRNPGSTPDDVVYRYGLTEFKAENMKTKPNFS